MERISTIMGSFKIKYTFQHNTLQKFSFYIFNKDLLNITIKGIKLIYFLVKMKEKIGSTEEKQTDEKKNIPKRNKRNIFKNEFSLHHKSDQFQ